MKPKKIINVHTHVHRTLDLKERIKIWEDCEITKACVHILSLEDTSERTFSNEDFIPIMKEYSDIMLGFARINLSWEPDHPDVIDKWIEKGFTGLKFIAPSYSYDHEIYHPLYERAQKLGIPVLFHTGFLAVSPEQVKLGVSTDKMRAMKLDLIGRAFPDLRMMCAHIGMPLYEEGLNLIENFKNIWGDYSGGGGSPKKETELRKLFSPLPGIDMSNPDENLALNHFKKLCFATDNPDPPKYLGLNQRLLDELEIPDDLREDFYWRNAEDWLGFEV